MVKEIKNMAVDLDSGLPKDFLESLNFDDSAKQMDALKALIFDAPETSEAKINFFKEEIASGRYQIQAEQIAAKLIEHHLLAIDAELA